MAPMPLPYILDYKSWKCQKLHLKRSCDLWNASDANKKNKWYLCYYFSTVEPAIFFFFIGFSALGVVCDNDVMLVLWENTITQQPAGVTGSYAYGHVAVGKESLCYTS
jgi:hypothetical protein